MVSSTSLLSLFLLLLPTSSSCLASSLSRGNDDITGVLFENLRRPETTEEPPAFLKIAGADSSSLQLPQQHFLLGGGGDGVENKGGGRGDREHLGDEREHLASEGGIENLSGGVGRDYLGSFYTRDQLGSRRVGGGREQLSSSMREQLSGSIREQLGGNIRKQFSGGSSTVQLTDGGGEQLSSSIRERPSGSNMEQLSGGSREQVSGGSREQLSGGSREQLIGGSSREQLSGGREQLIGGSREQQIGVGSEEQLSGGNREQLAWDHSISDYGTDRRQGDRMDNSRQMGDSAETLPLGDAKSRLLSVPAESTQDSADGFRPADSIRHHHQSAGLRAAFPSQGKAGAGTSSSSISGSGSLLSWGEQLGGSSLTEERKQLPDTAAEMLSKLVKGELLHGCTGFKGIGS
jgi:hypothetical protein